MKPWCVDAEEDTPKYSKTQNKENSDDNSFPARPENLEELLQDGQQQIALSSLVWFLHFALGRVLLD